MRFYNKIFILRLFPVRQYGVDDKNGRREDSEHPRRNHHVHVVFARMENVVVHIFGPICN